MNGEPTTFDTPRAGDGHDELLAYLRGELSRERTSELARRLAVSPALRDELAWLRAAGELVQAERTDASADVAFAKLEAALAQSPVLNPRARRSWFAKLGDLMRDYMHVLQPAFIALVVVQTGVIGYLLNVDDRIESPAVVRGGGASCFDVWITPRADVSIGSLRDWVLQYGGSIAAGPDSQGRLRIALPDRDASAGFAHDAAAARIAERVERTVQCGAATP
ncbi:anti-sigma factor family protein [Paraburkholderia caballeronis]|uniref:Uncharacterized protein n=1 Tax=Paraburkholderia caballeronis TaxID=416943 RepID=A0A1H7P1F0_9BURK|nr:hypothetical protein [Paraburkholderia caballeronis]PXW25456.1 hypothetical protein C7403_105139 [Paraburkholderia caballeronis]PXX01063.1 hypothetical protein C7407_105138 [Paraburkholderia caballeronis]RAJ99584.1 hypothetical protein C7409_105313 [Paraburkholderia caballeronis]SEE36645.1 hypothetical protein SAMN05445871_5290 [Paraburkholderia caballeronis]SEL28897.1 hypothetical protein SAMN05192542_106158 [Paraburkholderia caballeronis]